MSVFLTVSQDPLRKVRRPFVHGEMSDRRGCQGDIDDQNDDGEGQAPRESSMTAPIIFPRIMELCISDPKSLAS